MARVLTIILNYKTAPMTLKAAQSALTEMADIDGEILLVDNASGDGSFEAMQEYVTQHNWDRVRVVQSGHNGGFGAGNNFGIRTGMSDGTQPDFYYILNSDAFPDPGSIQALHDHLCDTPQTGFAGSYIHGPEGDVHLTTFRFPSALSELEGAARFGPISKALRGKAVPLPTPQQTCVVDWLAGASLMMRRETLQQIGLFDETFFLYFEETDLCRRAKLAGWPTVFVRNSEVTHIGSVSTGMKSWRRMPAYWFQSRWHYFAKNHGRLGAVLASLSHITGGLFWRLRRVLQRKPQADPDYFLRDLIAHDAKAALRRASPPREAVLPEGAGT